mgnify:CR=1 FL=1
MPELSSTLLLDLLLGLIIVLFVPFGIDVEGSWTGLLVSFPALAAKLAIGGFLLALIETVEVWQRRRTASPA